MRWFDRVALLGARVRFPMLVVGVCLPLVGGGGALLGAVGVALIGAAMAMLFLLAPPRRQRRALGPPVVGRWLAANSPASKAPSHGTHAYGQTYAVDLVYDPDGTGGPRTGWWPPARPPTAFASFGQPIVAPADGVVVARTGWQRDHWSRTSWPAMAYFVIEGLLRELTGPGRVLGNHLVVRLDDGTYALLAHLQRRSITVKRGERVTAGQVVAACGNSGNTTEPHLHVQVMDHRWPLFAAGIPFALAGAAIEDATEPGLPANGKHLETSTAPHPG